MWQWMIRDGEILESWIGNPGLCCKSPFIYSIDLAVLLFPRLDKAFSSFSMFCCEISPKRLMAWSWCLETVNHRQTSPATIKTDAPTGSSKCVECKHRETVYAFGALRFSSLFFYTLAPTCAERNLESLRSNESGWPLDFDLHHLGCFSWAIDHLEGITVVAPDFQCVNSPLTRIMLGF